MVEKAPNSLQVLGVGQLPREEGKGGPDPYTCCSRTAPTWESDVLQPERWELQEQDE